MRRLGALCAGYLAAPLIPSRFDRWIVDRFVALHSFRSGCEIDRLAQKMSDVLGASLNQRDPQQLAREHYRIRIEAGWGRLRGLHRRGWRPRLEIDGIEHLRHGLQEGRGALLWGMSLCGNSIVKQAMAEAGIPVTHLSSAQHGAPAATRLGLQVVAPIYCRAENQYLARRVIIPRNGSLSYLRELMDCLSRNACVSIMGEHAGRQSVVAKLFGREVRFATGAPSLAWRLACPLLPVGAVRRGPSHFSVFIENPILIDRSRERKQAVRAAVEEFSSRLKRRIAARPADWQCWFQGRV